MLILNISTFIAMTLKEVSRSCLQLISGDPIATGQLRHIAVLYATCLYYLSPVDHLCPDVAAAV